MAANYQDAINVLEACLGQYRAFGELKDLAVLMAGREQYEKELSLRIAVLEAQEREITEKAIAERKGIAEAVDRDKRLLVQYKSELAKVFEGLREMDRKRSEANQSLADVEDQVAAEWKAHRAQIEEKVEEEYKLASVKVEEKRRELDQLQSAVADLKGKFQGLLNG